jgi:hypothetical protein
LAVRRLSQREPLDRFAHLLVASGAAMLRQARDVDPSYRAAAIANHRRGLAMDLGWVDGSNLPDALEAKRLLQAGRDEEALAICEELTALPPADVSA